MMNVSHRVETKAKLRLRFRSLGTRDNIFQQPLEAKIISLKRTEVPHL